MADNNQVKADIARLIKAFPRSKLYKELAADRKLLQTAFEDLKLWTEDIPNTTRDIKADEDGFEIILTIAGQIKYQIKGYLKFSSPYRPRVNYGPFPHQDAYQCIYRLQGIGGKMSYIYLGHYRSGPLTETAFLTDFRNWLSKVNNSNFSWIKI